MRTKFALPSFCRCLLLLIVFYVVSTMGCGAATDITTPDQVAEGFTAGSGDSFGTLTDAGGSYDIHTENGEISEIAVSDSDTGEDATLTLPSADDPTIEIVTEDGDLTITQSDDDPTKVLVSLSDPLLGNYIFEADADTIPLPLSNATVKPSSSQTTDCSINRNFLDDLCEAAGQLDVDQIVELVLAELDLPDSSAAATEQIIRELFDKYLGPLMSFCESWSDFREDGDPCDL